MRLTKTDILAGLQCHKELFLLKNHPEFKKSINTPAMITGQVVDEHARNYFEKGIMVSRFQPDADPFEETQNLISNSSYDAIFQAGFFAEDVEVFVDVLERESNHWNIVEVKASTEVKDHFIDDLAIQFLTALRAGLDIGKTKLMFINNEFEYLQDGNYEDLFIIENLTDRVCRHLLDMDQQIERLRKIPEQPQPEIPISGHCKKPNPCGFRSFCEETGPKYPVGKLPYASKVIPKLHANHIYDIRDIPISMLKSDTQLKVRRITLEGKAELDPAVREVLNELAYPRYYLDFETVSFAIPIWVNTKPYQQIPFQFSCHIEETPSEVIHKEFLDVSGNDPRRSFAEALIESCGNAGPIIVYNETFEKGRIKELSNLFPDLAETLLELNERIFDLYPVVKKHYYHPDMKGSWSIKYVLPCLVPELNYKDLGAVQDGTQAQQAYFDLTANTLNEKEQKQLKNELLEYCKLDTLAMVEIVHKLEALNNH